MTKDASGESHHEWAITGNVDDGRNRALVDGFIRGCFTNDTDVAPLDVINIIHEYFEHELLHCVKFVWDDKISTIEHSTIDVSVFL